MHIIYLPEIINLDTIEAFVKELDESANRPKVAVDINTIKFITPKSMLLFGSKLKEWKQSRLKRKLVTKLSTPDQSDPLMYMRHMGFFDFIQTKTVHGKEMGQATGSASYVPIRKLKRPEFVSLKSWYEEIVNSIRPLASVLAGSFLDTEENRFYIYTLREIVRNVFEHSGADTCFICGQRWADGRVEICLLDEGIGVLKSLSRSHSIQNDDLAIQMALEPGVSSTNSLDERDNIYDNSGYGLFVLSEVVSAFGKFTLGSNSRRIIVTKREKNVEQTNFRGTYVGIEINNTPKRFSQLLEDVIESGEAQAKNAISASSASKTLSLD